MLVSITDIPSLKAQNQWVGLLRGTTAKTAQYVFSGTSNYLGHISVLTRMHIIKALFTTNGNPFYAHEVFGESQEKGGWVNGLEQANIIKKTGNKKDVFVCVGGDIYKKTNATEWQVTMPIEELHSAYEEIKQFIIKEI